MCRSGVGKMLIGDQMVFGNKLCAHTFKGQMENAAMETHAK
jgi:hypothetical protein